MAVTYTLAIKDKNDISIFSRASLASSATSTIWADKYDELGTTKVEGALLRTPMAGPVDVTITASEGTTDVFDVIVYYENNGKVFSYGLDVELAGATTTTVSEVPVDGYLIGISCTADVLGSLSPSISPSVSPSTSPSSSTSPSASFSPSLSPSVSPSA